VISQVASSTPFSLLFSIVKTITLNTIERVETLKGTVQDVEELNTRLGI
jgi:hypothetical protein